MSDKLGSGSLSKAVFLIVDGNRLVGIIDCLVSVAMLLTNADIQLFVSLLIEVVKIDLLVAVWIVLFVFVQQHHRTISEPPPCLKPGGSNGSIVHLSGTLPTDNQSGRYNISGLDER